MVRPERLISPGMSQAVSQLPDPTALAHCSPEGPPAGSRPAAAVTPCDQASSNLAMTSVSASPSRVHSWNAGSAIIVSM